MATTRFPEISIRGKRRWKDADGKWHQETRKFFQTINPWNVKDGRPKNASEIRAELLLERSKWLTGEALGE
jgi:hypothetical protein